MTPEEWLEKYPPTYLGPTWKVGPDGNWLLPECTLGYDVLAWMMVYLGPLGADQISFTPTPEQARFILWWYAINPATGRFLYSEGVFQRLKGAGKDPLVAALGLLELCGPCRFGGWISPGVPRVIPVHDPWIQFCANSYDQTENTTAVLPTLITERLRKEYGLEVAKTQIFKKNRQGRLQAASTNPAAVDGKRTTFTVCNEIQWWTKTNKGSEMYKISKNNATKINGGRILSIANAYIPGDESVLEEIRGDHEKRIETTGSGGDRMYDSIEAHPDTPLDPECMAAIIPAIRGDATWLPIDSIISQLSSTINPAENRRVWLNQIVTTDDALYSPADWDALGSPHYQLRAGDEIVLGFDGGKSDDSTALVAMRLSDMSCYLLGLWERPKMTSKGKWRVDRTLVDDAVDVAFNTYKVKGFLADVAGWESYIDKWYDRYAHQLIIKGTDGNNPIYFDMRGSKAMMAKVHEALVTSIFDQKLRHNGDLGLRRHLLNARRHNNGYGIVFRKETPESSKKVDAYAALVLAHEAARRVRYEGRQSTGLYTAQ